ncbi:NFACT family protein [Candidatus Micrarchaeota archaeon]|nr:NFACT family protein [Candidatus Micrarchaeota archaeon]
MHEMSNLDLNYMIQELQILVDSRLGKIFEIEKNEFRIKLNVPGKGSLDLTFVLKERLHLTNIIKEAPQEPSNFIMFLRKYFENSRLRAIEQYKFDRIVVFTLEKEKKYYFIVEMFSKGNVIATDENYKILNCYRAEEWKDRRIKVKETYKFPASSKLDPRELTIELLKDIMEEKYLIACLANKINLGTLYLEEICLRLGLNPKKNAKDMTEKEIALLHAALMQIMHELKPRVYYENNVPLDYSLISLKKYPNLVVKEFSNLSQALDEFVLIQKPKMPTKKEEKKHSIERKLADQLEHLEELELKSAEYKKAGDLIYAHFDTVTGILEVLHQLRKNKKSWQEIEETLKGKIVSLDKKSGKLTIEL